MVLGAVYLLARQVVRSRFGRLLVAVRGNEDRVRFLGYNPATVKTITFALSAGMAGLWGWCVDRANQNVSTRRTGSTR